jgi:hypothetical protein
MPFAARGPVVLALALCAVTLPVHAEQPTLLGASRDWTAYQANTTDGKVCYALSRPIQTTPKKVARDPMYVLISTWPNRNVRDELQIIPGYVYRDGEPVVAQVGRVKVEFFTRNDGKSGSAWVKEPADENALVSAMRSGFTLTVSGTSKRGTRTIDTYSLSGIATALDRAHDACRDTAK